MRYSLVFFVAAFLLLACNEVSDSRNFRSPDEIVNPNGDSELALVMRHLHFEADKAGRAIESGREVDLTELRKLVRKLDTAQPTDSSSLDAEYYALSGQLREKAEAIGGGDRVLEFNSFVSTCVTCHKMTCPGPIKKIGKLLIKV